MLLECIFIYISIKLRNIHIKRNFTLEDKVKLSVFTLVICEVTKLTREKKKLHIFYAVFWHIVCQTALKKSFTRLENPFKAVKSIGMFSLPWSK